MKRRRALPTTPEPRTIERRPTARRRKGGRASPDRKRRMTDIMVPHLAAIMRHELFGVFNALGMTVHLIAEMRAAMGSDRTAGDRMNQRTRPESDRVHLGRLSAKSQEHLERAARIVDSYLDQVQILGADSDDHPLANALHFLDAHNLSLLLRDFVKDIADGVTTTTAVTKLQLVLEPIVPGQLLASGQGLSVDEIALRLLLDLMWAWIAESHGHEQARDVILSAAVKNDQLIFSFGPVDATPESNDLRIFEKRLLRIDPSLQSLAVARRVAIQSGGSVQLNGKVLELSLPVSVSPKTSV